MKFTYVWCLPEIKYLSAPAGGSRVPNLNKKIEGNVSRITTFLHILRTYFILLFSAVVCSLGRIRANQPCCSFHIQMMSETFLFVGFPLINLKLNLNSPSTHFVLIFFGEMFFCDVIIQRWGRGITEQLQKTLHRAFFPCLFTGLVSYGKQQTLHLSALHFTHEIHLPVFWLQSSTD